MGPAQAQDSAYQLSKNPFGQPEMLKHKKAAKKPAIKKAPVAVTPPEVKLTATLISVTEPMVIANEQLLGIGDELEGMRLQMIDEGRAVFLFRGKTYVYTIEDEPKQQTR